MKEYLISLTSYNTWANTKILNFVNDAGEDRTAMTQKSSFASIHHTVLHILDAQVIWFSRLQGVSPVDWPGKNFTGSTRTACIQLVDNSKHFEDLAGKLTETDIKRVVSYHNIKSDKFQNTVEQIMVHVMNHGTFHRGQLITMLRGAGVTALASTDMITFFREQGRDLNQF